MSLISTDGLFVTIWLTWMIKNFCARLIFRLLFDSHVNTVRLTLLCKWNEQSLLFPGVPSRFCYKMKNFEKKKGATTLFVDHSRIGKHILKV